MRHSPPLLAMLPMYYMYISRILSRLTGVRSCCYCAVLLLLLFVAIPVVVVVSFCWRCCSLSLPCPPPRLWMLMWMWMRLCGSFCCCQPWCSPTWASSLSACACCGSPALRCFYSTVDCLKCKFALIIPWQATSATASLQQQRSRRRRRHRRHPLTPKQGPQHER